MGILTENLTFDLVAIAIAIVIGVITFLKYHFKFWERAGLPYMPVDMPFGNSKKLIFKQSSIGEIFQEYYQYFKSKKLRHGGIFLGTNPFYVPVDIDIVKAIMQTDFQHFMNHGIYFNEDNDPLSGHLFNLEGTKWRNMRIKLTPTFTSGKMKLMFQTLADCTHGLTTIMDDAATNKNMVDIKEILGRFTTDIIGSAAFGIECNSLKDPNAEFRKYGRKVFEIDSIERIRQLMAQMAPHWFLKLIGFKATKNDISKFFLKAVKEVVEYREKNNIYRKDFMHLLLQLKNHGKVSDDTNIKVEKVDEGLTITLNELAAQAFVFFVAGFETSSTTMTFALYEIATNPDVQKKMREEIKTVLAKHNNELTYDGMMEMTYMDKVLNETLRKYPPVPMLIRKCNKDYIIPGTNIELKSGTNVGIPALGIHKDPEYYPNPEKFDPERFTEEAKSKRPHLSWIPFGEGPRLCIGLRFGLLQSKVGLTTLLRNYQISLNKKTHSPLEMDKASFISSAKGGVWLDVEKLN